jgi:hypothetical protein
MGGNCLGTGMPGPMPGSGGYPMEIHRRPEQIIVVSEAHSEIRRIYLDDSIGTSLSRCGGQSVFVTKRTSVAAWTTI